MITFFFLSFLRQGFKLKHWGGVGKEGAVPFCGAKGLNAVLNLLLHNSRETSVEEPANGMESSASQQSGDILGGTSKWRDLKALGWHHTYHKGHNFEIWIACNITWHFMKRRESPTKAAFFCDFYCNGPGCSKDMEALMNRWVNSFGTTTRFLQLRQALLKDQYGNFTVRLMQSDYSFQRWWLVCFHSNAVFLKLYNLEEICAEIQKLWDIE